MKEVDVVIVGAGAVGASLAYRLAPHRSVLLLEREEQPGYHSTGRSAAHYTDVIGGTVVQALSEETRRFIDDPPAGFTDYPLLRNRPVLLLIGRDTANAHFDEASLAHLMGRLLFRLDLDKCLEQCPVIRPDKVSHGLYEPSAGDIDVGAIHGGYLKAARQAGAELACDAEVEGLERRDGVWQVTTRAGTFRAPVVANCAGAWGDVLAGLAGIEPVGLQPCRRTALTFRGPDGVDCASWPLVADDGESFYFKPEAGLIMGSLADETPSAPCDAQPEELDLAQAAENIMAWTTFDIRRFEKRWAGLRSFVADRLPVTGWDDTAEGFFWNIGQGGAGIQTSAALSAYAAAAILDWDLPDNLAAAGLTRETLSPGRLRA
jgi:D-arginine dehydrogenase